MAHDMNKFEAERLAQQLRSQHTEGSFVVVAHGKLLSNLGQAYVVEKRAWGGVLVAVYASPDHQIGVLEYGTGA